MCAHQLLAFAGDRLLLVRLRSARRLELVLQYVLFHRLRFVCVLLGSLHLTFDSCAIDCAQFTDCGSCSAQPSCGWYHPHTPLGCFGVGASLTCSLVLSGDGCSGALRTTRVLLAASKRRTRVRVSGCPRVAPVPAHVPLYSSCAPLPSPLGFADLCSLFVTVLPQTAPPAPAVRVASEHTSTVAGQWLVAVSLLWLYLLIPLPCFRW